MRYVSRSSWGARSPRCTSTNITPKGSCVHYEGEGKLTGFPHEKCASRVRSIQNFHMDDRGWCDIAYNFLVCEHGVVFEGRGLRKRSAAQGSDEGNQYYYAVCLMIGDDDPLTLVMKEGVRDAIDYAHKNGAGGSIRKHSDFFNTSCPGTKLSAWVNQGAPRPSVGDDMTPAEMNELADLVASRVLSRVYNGSGDVVGEAIQQLQYKGQSRLERLPRIEDKLDELLARTQPPPVVNP